MKHIADLKVRGIFDMQREKESAERTEWKADEGLRKAGSIR